MKYAKHKPEIGRRETWDELVTRNMEMHIKRYPKLEDEIREAYKFVYDKKVLPSMRSLQFGGKPIEISPNRVYNCAYLPMDDWRAFSETMFLLLGGTGVGYSVQYHHVDKLPEIRKPNPNRNRRFLIGDSIEGWADTIKVLMRAYFEGKSTPVFDYSDIRPKGAQLVTSGGKAPGPQPLKDCVHNIIKILDTKEDGDRLSTLEVHDIICFIADAVLAGGIRRAALISLFSFDDEVMATCKFGNWWELNPHRGRANNSAVIMRHRVKKNEFLAFWERVKKSGSGEPGVYFSHDKDMGTNPCLTGDSEVIIRNSITSNHSLIRMDELVSLYNALPVDSTMEILSYNTTTNIPEWKELLGSEMTRRTASIVELELESGEMLKLTPDHLVYTVNREYIKASELVESDEIVLLQKGERKMAQFKTAQGRIKKIKIRKNEDVYDVAVADNHNFFANGVLVHNCAEIALRSNQFCNLTEVNASNVSDQHDLNKRVRVAAFIGTLQAGYTDFHYLRDIWKRTTEKEALVGVGMTGIASGVVFPLDLEEAAKEVLSENKRVANLIGINSAARTTTVKPSGCMIPSTKIKTSKGVISFEQLFELNGYDLDKLNDVDALFLPVTEKIYALDMNNEYQEITQLYVNGMEDTFDIEMEDGSVIACTPNHRFLVENRGWVRADELQENDEIKSYSTAKSTVLDI